MLAEDLKSRIRRSGPLSFSNFVEACLYDSENGFYTKTGRAGRRGDFITSPEVGPVFGHLIANWLDQLWTEIQKPKDFQVIEVGAGCGTLARTILDSEPKCLESGSYVMVERSEELRKEHPTSEKLVSTMQMPEGPIVGAVIANELLDNLPFDLLEGDGNCWKEVCIDLMDDQFIEILTTEKDPPIEIAPLKGARIPVQTQSNNWIKDVIEKMSKGSILLFDYGSTTQEMSQRHQDSWLRTFKRHFRGDSPLEDVGNQDVTVEVAIDQLPKGFSISKQKQFLENQGINKLVEEGRKIWEESSSIGDLKAVKARSRITEADALLDPKGLGGFFVFEWKIGSSGAVSEN